MQPKFHEGSALRSNRDSDNNALLWKRNRTNVQQSNSDGQVISRIQRDIAKLKRRQLGYPGPVQITTAFQIYNIGNALSVSDNWRTFQIRGGYVAYRPIWPDGTTFLGFVSNSEFPLFTYATDVIFNVDFYDINEPQSPNAGGNVVLLNTSDVWINQNIVLHSGDGVQIVLDQIFDDFGEIHASFWLELHTPATAGFSYWKLNGRMFSIGTNTIGRPVNPWPDSNTVKNTIPLGIVSFFNNTPSSGIVTQYQMGNLVNRYPTAPPNSKLNGPIFYRGAWTADSLSGKIFYPGDLILDDTKTTLVRAQTVTAVNVAFIDVNNSGAPHSALQWQYYWACISGVQQSVPPTLADANWIQFGVGPITFGI